MKQKIIIVKLEVRVFTHLLSCLHIKLFISLLFTVYHLLFNIYWLSVINQGNYILK